MSKDIITFKDFLSNITPNVPIFEDLEESGDLDNDSNFMLRENKFDYIKKEFELTEDEVTNLNNLINIEDESDDFYKLYRDLNENFTCDIFIEGASPEKSSARLIVETKDWNLVFKGSIENGKCTIPIRKLDILNENLTGDIKLEIIAEGNVFVPWESKFLVKSSKLVSTLNEKVEKKVGVRVDKIR